MYIFNFCSYNGEWDLARKAMDDVLYRAQLELYPEPLLVGDVVQHFLSRAFSSVNTSCEHHVSNLNLVRSMCLCLCE